MNTLNYVACGKYFVAMDSKLVEVEIKEIRLKTDVSNYSKYIVTCNGEEVKLPYDTKFYRSEKAFIEGIEADKCTVNSNIVCRALNCNYANEQFSGWIISEHIVEEVTFDIPKITITKEGYAYTQVREGYVTNDKYYKTRQEALDNNIVKVVDQQGNESEIVGYKLRLKLDDKQQILVDQFTEAFEKLKEAGISLVFDDESYTLHAFNKRNFKDAEQVFYEGDAEHEFEHKIISYDLPEIGSVDFTAHGDRYIGVDVISE